MHESEKENYKDHVLVGSFLQLQITYAISKLYNVTNIITTDSLQTSIGEDDEHVKDKLPLKHIDSISEYVLLQNKLS